MSAATALSIDTDRQGFYRSVSNVSGLTSTGVRQRGSGDGRPESPYLPLPDCAPNGS